MIPAMQPRQLSSVVRKPVLLVNIVLGVLVLGGGAWAYETVSKSGTPVNAAASVSSADQAQAGVHDVTATVSTSGTVASSDVVAATFATNGTVTKIYVTLGQAVKKGQTLARIDSTASEEQLQSAQDNLTSAEDSLTRAQDSADTASIDTAQTQVDTAQDNVTTAEAAVTGCVLKAPIAGTIIAQNGVVGASTGSSSSNSSSPSSNSNSTSSSSPTSTSSSGGFIQIADLKKMEVDTDFAEADATKLKTGMKAAVTWNALTGATATGTVASIDPTATTSNNVVSYGVVVKLTSLPTGIRIGQSTNVVVTTATAGQVLSVPSTAVTTTGTRSTVTIVGQTVPTQVTIGVIGDTYTQIDSGLTAGQKVKLPTVNTSGTTTSTNPFAGGGGLGGAGGFGGGGGGFGGGGAGRGAGGN
jgi:membrane fusion protein, macrolide-specific efflux system